MFHVYAAQDDGRIWISPVTVFASVQQSAEKIIRTDYRSALHMEFKAKSEDFDDPKFDKHNLEWVHEGIVPVRVLKKLGIYVPSNQGDPFIYPDGKTPEQVLQEEAELNEPEIPEYKPKYSEIKCEWCGQQVPKNGAAQYSHLRKHINELVNMKMLSKPESKKINSIKLNLKHRKIFRKAFH